MLTIVNPQRISLDKPNRHSPEWKTLFTCLKKHIGPARQLEGYGKAEALQAIQARWQTELQEMNSAREHLRCAIRHKQLMRNICHKKLKLALIEVLINFMLEVAHPYHESDCDCAYKLLDIRTSPARHYRARKLRLVEIAAIAAWACTIQASHKAKLRQQENPLPEIASAHPALALSA